MNKVPHTEGPIVQVSVISIMTTKIWYTLHLLSSLLTWCLEPSLDYWQYICALHECVHTLYHISIIIAIIYNDHVIIELWSPGSTVHN